MSDRGATLTLRCPCGVKMKVPAAAAGRRARCKGCDRVFKVPVRKSPAAHAAAETDLAVDSTDSSDDLIYAFARDEETAPAAPKPEVAPSAAPAALGPAASHGSLAATGGGPKCPSCRRTLPVGAKVCVECGVDVKTGRSLITTQEDNLDSAYIYAENIIRVISWLIWFGLYPIASEAFGTAKPYVIRGIAILTVASSLLFLAFDCSGSSQMDKLQNLMLWSGTTNADTIIAHSDLANYDLTDEERVQVEDEIGELTADAGEHHPYQLLTHALLHADLLHLAGNLLFLIVLGSRVNALIGNIALAVLYPLFAVAAGVAHVIASSHDLLHPMLGASGAVMGLAGMYLVFFPVHKVHMAFWWRFMLLWPMSFKLFAVRGFWVVLFYIAFDVLYTSLGIDDQVAHWAHLGGFIAGVLVAVTCLLLRLVNARGGDIFSVVLGRYAWFIVGRPRTAPAEA